MKNIVIVAPFIGKTMRQCLAAFAGLENTKIGIISQQPEEALPARLQQRISGHMRVSDCLNSEQLTEATHRFNEQWGKVDRLIGYLEHLQTPLAETRTRLNIDGMQHQQALNFRDKNQMKDVLRRAGLPVAAQAKIHSAQDAQRFIEEVGYPIILKPLAGVGSKNTMRVRNERDLYRALNTLLPAPERPVQAEQFVRGEEHTLEAVTINGTTVWQSSTYYLPGPLQVLENPWMQYCVLLPREQTQPHVRRFAPVNRAALSTLGMHTGISHMEWFLQDNQQPIISEVGARPPGVNIMNLMAAAHEVDIWEKWARLSVYDEWNMPERKYAVGCAFLRGQGRGNTIRAIEGLEEAQEKVQGMVVSANLPSVGQLRSEHYEGDGWIIIRHPQTAGAVQGLRVLLQTISITLG